MKYTDKNNEELKTGDVINLHQTVNGENIFVVLYKHKNHIKIVYGHNMIRDYEYDVHDMLSPCKLNGIVEWEIVGNIHSYTNSFRK